MRNFAHGFHWQGLLGLDPGESLAGGQTFMKALSQKWSEPTIGIYLAAHTQQVGQYEQYDNTSSITDVGELSLGYVPCRTFLTPVVSTRACILATLRT